ncbi:MAG: hypothetical protein PVI30_23575 [Myxococcales bacterium]|jgi:hypothetical protein
MKTLSRILCAAALLGSSFVTGCDQAAEAKVQVEKLPEVKPNLPAVPTLPPPPHPTQYADQSYSVYGLRRQLRNTIDTEVDVTGYIAKIYEPPECPKKQKCPLPPAPHMWLSDVPGEQDESKLLLVAGYAENQEQIDEAIKDAKRGKTQDPAELEEMGLVPIPTDFAVGNKVKVKGRFAFVGGSGFQSSEGVLGYMGHETLESASEEAAAK